MDCIGSCERFISIHCNVIRRFSRFPTFACGVGIEEMRFFRARLVAMLTHPLHAQAQRLLGLRDRAVRGG